MKILAVGRNYLEHVKELNSPLPTAPVIFMKPDTAILRDNKPFYHPDFSNDIHHEIEVVLKVCKEGKHIPEKFAENYFDEIGLGIDFTARDIQQKHKEKGLPWELAKAFDNSAPVSRFILKNEFKNVNELLFRLDINGTTVQKGNTAEQIFPANKLISFISQYITLKKGDLIFTGTPKGVGKIAIGDRLQGYLEENLLLDFYIR